VHGAGFLIGGVPAEAPAAALQVAFNPIHGITFGVNELVTAAAGRPDANPHDYSEHYRGEQSRYLLEGAPPA
jgi:hypothetical protein